MSAPALRIELPLRGEAAALPWSLLFAAPPGARVFRAGAAIELCPVKSGPLRLQCAAAAALTVEVSGDGRAQRVPIAPGRSLLPADADILDAFLRDALGGLDHIGINLAQGAVAEADWRAFSGALAAAMPVYRLDLPGANEVLIALPGAEGEPALELVYDSAATCTTLHFCLKVNAGKAQLEATFAAPRGGYKPGDEAFFRSVALPPALAVPAYLDLTFSEAAVAPWPAVVAAMGRRLR